MGPKCGKSMGIADMRDHVHHPLHRPISVSGSAPCLLTFTTSLSLVLVPTLRGGRIFSEKCCHLFIEPFHILLAVSWTAGPVCVNDDLLDSCDDSSLEPEVHLRPQMDGKTSNFPTPCRMHLTSYSESSGLRAALTFTALPLQFMGMSLTHGK